MIPLDKRSHSIRWIFDSHNTIDWNKVSSTTMNTQTSLPSHLTSLKNGDKLIWRIPPKDILPVHVVSLQKDNLYLVKLSIHESDPLTAHSRVK